MDKQQEAIKAGVFDAWYSWLEMHPATAADIIQAAVKEAVSDWLNSPAGANACQRLPGHDQGEGVMTTSTPRLCPRQMTRPRPPAPRQTGWTRLLRGAPATFGKTPTGVRRRPTLSGAPHAPGLAVGEGRQRRPGLGDAWVAGPTHTPGN